MTQTEISLAADEIDHLRAIVQSDTAEGFIWYYALASGQTLPLHCARWIRDVYYARDELSMGFALEAFRESLKTTIFTNWLASYQLGCHPERSGMFIQASDQSATDNSKFVASIIEHNPVWKILFPHVEPDRQYGWGAQGYEVMRNDMNYGEWRQLRHKDPSLLGAGYKSSDIIGKHPNGFLFIDDMNDHHNTRSQKELLTCINVLNKVIKPLPTSTTWVGYIFTPWVPGDVGQNAIENPFLYHIWCPIYKTEKTEDGKLRITDEPIWPEEFPKERIEKIRRENPFEFALMYLCDREAVKGKILLREWIHWFPAEEIDPSWPVIIGVDYASVRADEPTKGKSYFALALFRVHPSGKLILCDGYRGYVSQGRAEDICKNWGEIHMEQLLHFGIEELGTGREFYGILMKSAPFKVKGIKVGNQSKGEKYELQMAPVFRRGQVWVSDDSGNEFLDQFYQEWLSYDELEQFTTDTLDAAYVGLRCAKGLIKKSILSEREDYEKIPESSNPYMAFVRR